MTRAELSRKTGISENSLIKYERAGQPDGQYPPTPKLAKLCFYLRIPTSEALFSCLDTSEFEITQEKVDKDDFAADAFYGDVLEHPEFQLVQNENFHLTQENAKMRSILRFIAVEQDGGWHRAPQLMRWLKTRLSNEFQALAEVESLLIAEGAIAPIELSEFNFPSAAQPFSYLPTSDDMRNDLASDSPLARSRDLEALRGIAGTRRIEQLKRSIELIEELQAEKGPDQSPNSPGPSENK